MRKGKFYRHLSYAVQAGLMVGTLGLFMPAAWAAPAATQLPTGGLSPTAAITASGANMTVDGKAANNVIAWDSFSIGANAAVNFTGSHNYLNYVTGRSLSEIYGTMSGGGNVYLFNPNGIIFGESANINVGSLYASTKKLNMEDLQAFAQGKDMLLTGEVVGDVVNRMKTNLSNMTITMEGDVVSFANYDAITGKLGQGSAQYDVHANKVHIGYEGNTAPTAAPTNLSAHEVESVYLKLIGQNDLGTQYDPEARLMLKEDVSGSILGHNSSDYFAGIFDGAGHTVTLKDNKPVFDSWDDGIKGAEIRNLTIAGSISTNVPYVAALAGTAQNTTIANVFNKAAVTSNCADGFVGGLIGEATGVRIKNSGNEGPITQRSGRAGGLLGVAHNSEVYNTYNLGEVSTSSVGTAGGLIARIVDYADQAPTKVVDSSNEGKVTGGWAGGLVGDIDNASISPTTFTNVFNKGAVSTGVESNPDVSYMAGGLIGNVFRGETIVENAYNSGLVAGRTADGIGNAIKDENAEISPTLTLNTVYNTGKVNGSDAFSYYDAGGNKTPVSSAAEIASSGAFADTSVWRIYGNNAPLLKSFLSPLYLPASSVTYDNGQAVYRLYVYGEPSHLQGYRSYGTQWGIYEGLVSSDQLGFDLFFEPVPATPSEETDYMSGYRAINGATRVDNNDTEEENLLDDAAAKAALDISSSVQHTTVTEDDIRAMMGSGGTTISSKTGDDVTTEHFEVGDFDDQSAGKVEH